MSSLHTRLKEALDRTHCDCERALCSMCRIISNGTTKELRDALQEIVAEAGGCDHDVDICWCLAFALLRHAAVELGEARWCACNSSRNRMHTCLRCHNKGIVYKQPRTATKT